MFAVLGEALSEASADEVHAKVLAKDKKSKAKAKGKAAGKGKGPQQKKAKTALTVGTDVDDDMEFELADLRAAAGTTPNVATGAPGMAMFSVAGQSVEVPLDGSAASRPAAGKRAAAPRRGQRTSGGGGGPGDSDDDEDTESDAGNRGRSSGGAGRGDVPGGPPPRNSGNQPDTPVSHAAPPPPPPGPETPMGLAAAPMPATPTVIREIVREVRPSKKRLELPKFKGLDGTMPVSTWLRAVHTIKRQQYEAGVTWTPREVFFEMIRALRGEAMRWYGTIAESIDPETDENLASLLRQRYTKQLADPEVIASLKERRQMRGEALVEYAANLRDIVVDRQIGEEWLIDAFLGGLSNSQRSSSSASQQTEDSRRRGATCSRGGRSLR